jgi:hypothetical protein
MLGLDKCVLRPFGTLTDWLILQPGPSGQVVRYLAFPEQNTRDESNLTS